MNYFYILMLQIYLTLNIVVVIIAQYDTQLDEKQNDLASILGRCRLRTEIFNKCMKDVFNDLRVYFPTGVPDYNIKPFDPHRCSFVEARRGDNNGIGGFQLVLRNVSEYGWTNSKVTKFKIDYDDNKIVYSQYFPDKSLDGLYEFSGKMFGSAMKNYGIWSLNLSDYSQTTTIRRLGGPGSLLKVNVEVNKIGGMILHISDFFGQSRRALNSVADTVINSMWQLGLPFMKPLINELVSTAFTDIFNESFRYFPIDDFMS